MACGKKPFVTRKMAKRWMKESNRKHKSEEPLTNVYFCKSCQAYHCTSMDKKESRKITRQGGHKKMNVELQVLRNHVQNRMGK